MHCTKISVEFEFGCHSRRVRTPKNVALGYDVGKISTGCLVCNFFLFHRHAITGDVAQLLPDPSFGRPPPTLLAGGTCFFHILHIITHLYQYRYNYCFTSLFCFHCRLGMSIRQILSIVDSNYPSNIIKHYLRFIVLFRLVF